MCKFSQATGRGSVYTNFCLAVCPRLVDVTKPQLVYMMARLKLYLTCVPLVSPPETIDLSKLKRGLDVLLPLIPTYAAYRGYWRVIFAPDYCVRNAR